MNIVQEYTKKLKEKRKKLQYKQSIKLNDRKRKIRERKVLQSPKCAQRLHTVSCKSLTSFGVKMSKGQGHTAT